MQDISLIIITHNSGSTLESCLKSVKGLVSEIVLVDDYSTDRTLEIARAHQAKVISKKLESCARQKQFALEQAGQEWVFLLDSDEVCPPELAREIKKKINDENSRSAYRIPRKNIYLGILLTIYIF